jgi:glycosyltransferase involved in cell wall biosynthesis
MTSWPVGWRAGTSAAAIGLASSGRTDDAIALIEQVAGTRGATDGALAGTALAIGNPDLAGRLADVPTDLAAAVDRNAGAALVAAEVRLARGEFTAAAALTDAYRARYPGDAYARGLARRIRGELTVRDPAWRPAVVRAPNPFQAVPGRVVHLLTNSLPYREAGYTLRAHEIARCQAAAGLEPHLATRAGFPLWDGHRRVPTEDTIDGVRYHRLAPDLPITTPADKAVEATAEAAATLVEELRPAVLHPASNHPNGQAALALRERYGIPVVYEVRGFLEESWLPRAGSGGTESERYRRTREVETAVMKAADAVVTLSDTMCREIADRGIPQERIVVVPNAVDAERFAPRPPDDALRSRLGLRAGVPVIGYLSTLTAFEGVGTLLEGLAELRRRGREVQGLIVGDGPVRDALEVQAERLGLRGRDVVFAGRVPRAEAPAHLALIDLFVVPRTADRVSQLVTPLKPFEAMAMERTVVVSDVAALREVVSDRETGVVFRAEDPLDLADHLEPLLDDPTLRATLGRAAREWVVTNRSWRQNGARYRDLYARLGAA